MKNVRLVIVSVFMASGFSSFAQTAEKTAEPKLIAVVNQASWCRVCKANGERFGAVLMPYSAKGVSILINDLSNEITKEASKQALEKANVYEAVNTIPRKGMGKMLKACGMAKDRKQTQDVAGLVTFIDPVSHEQIKQVSISESDETMNLIINKLIN